MLSVKQLMQSCTSRPNNISTCSLGLLGMLFMVFLTPILARNVPNAILLGLMALLIATIIPLCWGIKKSDRITLGVLALYMVIITAYKLIGASSAALYYYFNTVQFYFFFGAGLVMLPHMNKKQCQFLFLVICITVAFTAVHNVLLFFIHGASKYITLFQEAKYTSNSINTPYVSAIMLVSGIALIWGLQKGINLRSRIVSISIFLCGFMFIAVVAQRMIVLVLTAGMALLLLLALRDPKKLKALPRKKLYFLCAFILTLIVLLLVFLLPILRVLREVIPSPRIAKRINQLIRFFKTGDISAAGGSLTVRFELMATSWKTFTSSWAHLLFGAGDHRATNAIIGNHSYLIDELARYGILFSSISYFLLYRSLCSVYRNAQVEKGSLLRRQLHILLVIVVIRSFVGAIFDVSMSIIVFFMIPLACRLLSQKRPGQYLSKK